jgi:starvation-inducible DNA-binding protein
MEKNLTNTSIGITDDHRQSVANELMILLADEYVLYTKTLNAHWNIEGIDFNDKHKLFEMQFDQLEEFVDRIAERIRSIGHYVDGTLSTFLKLTHFTESNNEKNEGRFILKELLNDHESIIIHCRENIDRFAKEYRDVGTSDFITGLMEEHEKIAWYIRSHLR